VEKVTLRKFPYPFKSALSICSDIDGTDTAEDFLSIQTFLNTDRPTPWGPGIGLEIGNSFLPNRVRDTFAYFSNRPNDRAIIKDFIRAGYIDCLHAYGERSNSRQDVLKIIEALEQDGCKVKVWLDHSTFPTNLGHFNSKGNGDQKESPAYHADITLAYGIQFAWMGPCTTLIGQETPITPKALAQIFDPDHRRASLINLTKEIIKITLARLGNQRFAIQGHNLLIRIASLRDGHHIYEFIRCNNHWEKPRPSSPKLSYMLRPQVLKALVDSEGYTILYTHFGFFEPPELISAPTQAALRHLAEEYQSGHIYITTTLKLLIFCLVHKYLQWSYDLSAEKGAIITIHHLADPIQGFRKPILAELQGITFYVPDRNKASIFLGDKEIQTLTRNSKDHTGQESVMIPRTFLTYPL
jgi:hypothetical protein